MGLYPPHSMVQFVEPAFVPTRHQSVKHWFHRGIGKPPRYIPAPTLQLLRPLRLCSLPFHPSGCILCLHSVALDRICSAHVCWGAKVRSASRLTRSYHPPTSLVPIGLASRAQPLFDGNNHVRANRFRESDLKFLEILRPTFSSQPTTEILERVAPPCIARMLALLFIIPDVCLAVPPRRRAGPWAPTRQMDIELAQATWGL
jgi:hypothetical protein